MKIQLPGRYWHILTYGASLAALLLLMQFLEYRFLVLDHVMEIYVGIIAVLFTGLGIWLALKLSKPKTTTIIVEKELRVNSSENFLINTFEIEKLGISKRELEVLDLMARGLSNQEIADQLFVSLNTVKTHSSKVLEKMQVKRRTQAVEKAKRLSIIP